MCGLLISFLTSSNAFAQITKITLQSKDLLSRMSVDQSPVQDTRMPRADLTVKDMCIEDGKLADHEYIGVLLANVGAADAGPFELGFEYREAGTPAFASSPINGLRAGEQSWIRVWHECCQFVSISLIGISDGFSAIADPRYYKKSANDSTSTYEVKPVIPESNEANNRMTVNKADLKPCAKVTRIDRPAPAGVKTIKPALIKP